MCGLKRRDWEATLMTYKYTKDSFQGECGDWTFSNLYSEEINLNGFKKHLMYERIHVRINI